MGQIKNRKRKRKRNRKRNEMNIIDDKIRLENTESILK